MAQLVQDHGSVSQLQTESHGTEKGVLSSQKKPHVISAVKTVICGHISYSIQLFKRIKTTAAFLELGLFA